MLDENCVHFIHGGELYAAHSVTGLPFVAHCRTVNGGQRTSYFEIEYDQLPEQVKVWWTEYKEGTSSSESETAGSDARGSRQGWK